MFGWVFSSGKAKKRSPCVTKDVKIPTTRPEIPKYSNIILKEKKILAMIYNFSQKTRISFFFAPPPTDV